MKNFRENRKKSFLHSLRMPLIMFLLLLALLTVGILKFNQMAREQNLELAKDSLKKAIIQCYAIEGMYPPNVDYLKEQYDLHIDTNKYYVFYDCFSSNIMPEYDIFVK